MEQPDNKKDQIDTSDQDETVDTDKYTTEASDIETKDIKNTITMPRR